MFNEKDDHANGPLLEIFGNEARLEGNFTIGDSIQIECEIAGQINVEGKLVIGEKGIVRADVNTVDAIIRGQYQGDMVATGSVEITKTGRVTGNIETDSLVISQGGFFNGKVVKMEQSNRQENEPDSGLPLIEKATFDVRRSSANGV